MEKQISVKIYLHISIACLLLFTKAISEGKCINTSIDRAICIEQVRGLTVGTAERIDPLNIVALSLLLYGTPEGFKNTQVVVKNMSANAFPKLLEREYCLLQRHQQSLDLSRFPSDEESVVIWCLATLHSASRTLVQMID